MYNPRNKIDNTRFDLTPNNWRETQPVLFVMNLCQFLLFLGNISLDGRLHFGKNVNICPSLFILTHYCNNYLTCKILLYNMC